jgi:CMP-N,N'-diacetyllegionaminic acid synthase
LITLIPCRGGSKRVPGKNFRKLGGKPLVAWTIEAAHGVGLERMYLCTDEPEKALDASTYSKAPNVTVLHQPAPLHRDDCTDHEWISDALDKIRHENHLKGSVCAACSLGEDCMSAQEFILLRPTSPFRGPETIRRALEQWEACKDRLDSLRAVRKASEHPFKQWYAWNFLEAVDPDGLAYREMIPVMEISSKEHLHSRPTQSLTPAYVQSAALEVFWGRTILAGTLSGERVGMFETEGPPAFDINYPVDWDWAEAHVKAAALLMADGTVAGVTLPAVESAHDEVQSRSRLKRIAMQRGEPMPTFEDATAEPLTHTHTHTYTHQHHEPRPNQPHRHRDMRDTWTPGTTGYPLRR